MNYLNTWTSNFFFQLIKKKMDPSVKDLVAESPELKEAAIKADQTKTDNDILFGSIDYFTTVFKKTNKDHYLGMFIGLVIGMILIYYVLPMLRGGKA